MSQPSEDGSAGLSRSGKVALKDKWSVRSTDSVWFRSTVMKPPLKADSEEDYEGAELPSCSHLHQKHVQMKRQRTVNFEASEYKVCISLCSSETADGPCSVAMATGALISAAGVGERLVTVGVCSPLI